MRARSIAYRLLCDGNEPRHAGHRLVGAAILAAIALMQLGTVLATWPHRDALADTLMTWALPTASGIFLLEFLGRLWTAPEVVPHPGRAAPAVPSADKPGTALATRRAYLRSVMGVVDLVSALPVWVVLLLPHDHALVIVLAFFPLLKLVRYIPGMLLVVAVVRRELGSLFAALAVMLVLLVAVSTIMYLLERNAQPQVFASVAHALWFGIVTIATIGYGDMVPVTVLGRIFGGVTMVLGIAMFAVPAGILATGFANELRKREFVVTWRTVARVPLFAGLDAEQIATIAGMLRAHLVPANTVIVRRGEAAQSMFFLTEGEVEVDLEPRPVRLVAGDFFGEVALLRDLRRIATVTAITECRVLELDVADFRRLVAQYPAVRRELERTAADRLAV